MKHTTIFSLTLICMLAVAHIGKAQVKAFEKFRNIPDVSYVYISKTMLRMAKGTVKSNFGKSEINLGDMFDKLNSLQVISVEKQDKVAEIKKMVSDIVEKDKYDIVMEVANEDDAVTIYSKLDKTPSVVLMQTEDTKEHELNLIVFSGTFTEEDLVNITQKEGKKE